MRVFKNNEFLGLSNRAFYDKVFGVVRDIAPFESSFKVLRFITCQICLESDFGHSNLAVTCNNFIGMKKVRKRPTTQLPNDGVFGSYSDIYSCIFDLFIWYIANGLTCQHCLSVFEFEAFLKNSAYCPEDDYISKIKSLSNLF